MARCDKVWRRAALSAALCLGLAGGAAAEVTATGQALTPTAAAGSVFQPLNPDLPAAPAYVAGQASALALSPDGRTLLILTSGFNRVFGADGKFDPALSDEYLFVYDVSGPVPVKRQVLRLADSFLGLAWAPDGRRFYVSGGVDDVVLEFAGAPGGLRQTRRFPLGHAAGLGLKVKPEAAGLAVSPDGRRLLAANLQNDSVSLIDLVSGQVSETDLRPGAVDPARRGQPGGSFPRAVAFASDSRAYVASERDREVIALDIVGGRARVGPRIRTQGQPVALLAAGRGRLYAALDNTDAVAVIDTASGRILETIPTAAPPGLLGGDQHLGGAGSNSLALSPDRRTLLVTNGGENALALVALDAKAAGLKTRGKPRDDDGDGDDDDPASAVVGLIPTGWYPTAVAARPDGRRLYVVNGKSVPGANPAPAATPSASRQDRSTPAGRPTSTSGSWRRPAS